ncbi:MAG: tetratricopeptide repeat protein, partial [Hyphomicrobiaceae bacterium]
LKLHRLAIADFTEALRVGPRTQRILINRGAAFEAIGLVEDSIADYREALRIDPDNGQAKACLQRLKVAER